MEQAIWLFVGVVSVIIAIGIVYKALDTGLGDQKLDEMIWALDKLQVNLNFICKAPIDTRLSTEVRLPSGSVMNAENDKLCVSLTIEETQQKEVRCRFIECSFEDLYELDLDTDIAKRSFEVSAFNCIGTRKQNGIAMECQG